MIVRRAAAERGTSRFSWLDSRHSFSFADYFDPRFMGFGDLLVINDDYIAPGAGFPTHGHRDMEIVSYVVDGALEHKDSLGSGSVIRPGEVQRMSAGTGIRHSEYNPSSAETARLLQIWIKPSAQGLTPGYEQASIRWSGGFSKIAAAPGQGGAVAIHQDAAIYAAKPGPGEILKFQSAPGRRAWLQLVKGSVRLNGIDLAEGDGAAIEQEPELTIEGGQGAEILLFDLAP